MSCHYWVPTKRRYCKFPALSDEKYCSIHRTGTGENERVPCPLDPRHSIYKKDTESHLIKCSLASQRLFEANQPCMRLRCNVAPESFIPNEGSSDELPADLSTWTKFLSKIRAGLLLQLGDTYICDESAPFSPPPVTVLVERCAQSVTGKPVSEMDKHNCQNAALLALMDTYDESVVYAELGCGKAGLTRWLMEGGTSASYVLLDCEARRNKQENKQGLDVDRSAVVRLRLDIRDFDLAHFLTHQDIAELPESDSSKPGSMDWRIHQLRLKVSSLRARPSWPPVHLVGVAKHLCGAATDWGLRCLVQSGHPSISMLVATCCHHRCIWSELVGRDSLSALGLGEAQFKLMLGMAGWATTLDVDEEKRLVGRLVKSVVDLSRLVWLRINCPKMKLEYRKYISESVTPENFVIKMAM